MLEEEGRSFRLLDTCVALAETMQDILLDRLLFCVLGFPFPNSETLRCRSGFLLKAYQLNHLSLSLQPVWTFEILFSSPSFG